MVKERAWCMMAKKQITYLLIFCALISCGEETVKYEWYANESAPHLFPMELIEGNYLFEDGSKLYIPNRALVHSGWGNGFSSHSVGDDKWPIPVAVQLAYFSYIENKFYAGQFELPQAFINQLFSKGHFSPKLNEHVTYNSITSGIAPEGRISVWASSSDRRIEVFSGVADEVDLNWKKILDNENVSREEYIRDSIEEAYEEEGASYEAAAMQVERLKLYPDGLWQHYRQRYDWRPKIKGITPPKYIQRIEFFNGERDFYQYQDSEWEDQNHAIPSEIYMVWKDSDTTAKTTTWIFNEDEIFSAFEALNTIRQQKNSHIILNLEFDRSSNMKIKASVQCGDEVIILQKTKIEIYSASPSPERFKLL